MSVNVIGPDFLPSDSPVPSSQAPASPEPEQKAPQQAPASSSPPPQQRAADQQPARSLHFLLLLQSRLKVLNFVRSVSQSHGTRPRPISSLSSSYSLPGSSKRAGHFVYPSFSVSVQPIFRIPDSVTKFPSARSTVTARSRIDSQRSAAPVTERTGQQSLHQTPARQAQASSQPTSHARRSEVSRAARQTVASRQK